jgi:hypothetical protein
VVDTQFIEQVKQVLVHGAVMTHTGQFFHTSLELAQLEVRICTPILEASYNNFGCLLTFCWIKVLWENLWWIHKVSLHDPDQILPKLQREGDFFLNGMTSSASGFLQYGPYPFQLVLIGVQSNDGS